MLTVKCAAVMELPPLVPCLSGRCIAQLGGKAYRQLTPAARISSGKPNAAQTLDTSDAVGWWKCFRVLVMGNHQCSDGTLRTLIFLLGLLNSWSCSECCVSNKAVSLLHLSFPVVLMCCLVRKTFPCFPP